VQELIDRIRREGRVLPGGLLQVDGFLNHVLDPDLTRRMGEAFVERLSSGAEPQVDRILTSEVSGIAPALATSLVVGVPLTFARKTVPTTWTSPLYQADCVSRTKGSRRTLSVSSERLLAGERIWIIDDFLARGETLRALINIVTQAKAELTGVGVVIEKTFEGARQRFTSLDVPIVALAAVDEIHEANEDQAMQIIVRSG